MAPSDLTERTSTQISSGATPPAISASASAATAWAWARSERQRQKRTRPAPAPVSFFFIRASIGATTAPAASRIRRPERKLRSRRIVSASGNSRANSIRFF